MSTAIATEVSGQVVAQTTSLMEVISRAASDPSVDIDKMERLMAMHERMVAKQAESEFNDALVECQKECGAVAADANNAQTRSKYATYAKLDGALRPIYTRHGISISYSTDDSPKPEHVRVIAYVSRGSFTRVYRADMPADGKGAKGGDVMTKTHASGAAMSYGARYLLKSIFNIAIGEDDTDGNETGKKGMYAEGVEVDRRPVVQKLASDMLAKLRENLVADAVELAQAAGLSTEEKAFLWTFFDSKQRKSMTTVMDAKRKTSKITDAQKKRLEARIGEFHLDRENVKKYCADQYGVEHFADLTVADYEDLDATLETMAAQQ